MKLKLWSIQEESKLEEIRLNGRLICRSNSYAKEWDDEYRWMAKQMETSIGKAEVVNQYPIWAWYQYENVNKRKPDLRKSGHLPAGIKGVRIEFEKHKNEVLLSDFMLWHYPLSYKTMIALNEKEANEFETRLKKLKLENLNFSKLPKEIQNEIENSWDRIFDMKFEEEYYTTKINEKMIQACCWEINESEIVRIDHFKAR